MNKKLVYGIGILTVAIAIILLLTGCTPQPELPYDDCKEACINLSNSTCSWEWQTQINTTFYCQINQSTGNTTQWENSTSKECWCRIECPDKNRTFYTRT
jgi:hypothetical protein